METYFTSVFIIFSALLHAVQGESVKIIEPVDVKEMTVTVGEQIKIVCKAGDKVDLDFKHRGVYVHQLTDYSQRYSWLKSLDTEAEVIRHTLLITQVTTDDAGLIECVNLGDMFFDKDQIKVKVQINELFKSQLFVSPSSLEQYLVRGTQFSLTCSGGQYSEVYWMKDGSIVAETVMRPIVERADGSSRVTMLTFLSVDDTDAGVYKCVDEQKKWRASEEIKVSVVDSDFQPSGSIRLIPSSIFILLTVIILNCLMLKTQ